MWQGMPLVKIEQIGGERFQELMKEVRAEHIRDLS